MKKEIFIGCTVGLVLVLLFSAGVFSGWQHKLSDTLYQDRPPLSNVIIIAIDDKSIQELGRWPWDREVYLDLLPKLESAKVIGFDIAFLEPYESEVDRQIGELMSSLPIIIPVEYVWDEDYTTVLYPAPGIINRTETGFVNVFSDVDGITRTAPLALRSGTHHHAGLATQTYLRFAGKTIEELVSEVGSDIITINFLGRPGTFLRMPFVDALQENESTFKDKVVFVGATAPDLHDDSFVPTSHGKTMPGVEINANIFQTLLTKRFIHAQPAWSVILIILLFSVGISLLGHFSLRWHILASASLFIIYLLTAIALFNKGIIMNLIYPFLAILFSFMAVLGYRYLTEGREKQRIRSLFGKYVSKDVVEDILAKTTTDTITLTGEEREISVLFADIRGFTSMSEKMQPTEVVEMLNRFLGGMTGAIFEQGGTLDKYIGDCSMALFGAPLKQKHHALLAIKAGLGMQERLARIQKEVKVDRQQLREKLKRQGKKVPFLPQVNIGIGINSGPAVIGNMGSLERAEYTAIGDTVNLASRLCGLATGAQIIISQNTLLLVKDRITYKSLGSVKVKGKQKPIKIFEVTGLKKR